MQFSPILEVQKPLVLVPTWHTRPHTRVECVFFLITPNSTYTKNPLKTPQTNSMRTRYELFTPNRFRVDLSRTNRLE